MEKFDKKRAIPPGYMTIGEIAKKMNVTVRTLQYYDKEGLLSPSAESEGGRRLYTYKDIIKLHQIQSMKFLGFSLDDIKTRLPSINTVEEVSGILSGQAKAVREKINSLTDVLIAIEKLNMEVTQMQSVDWEKYANIVFLLQHKQENYWMMKYFDEALQKYTVKKFTTNADVELSSKKYHSLLQKARELQEQGSAPDSKESIAFAKEWWEFTLKFTSGDIKILNELLQVGGKVSASEWKDKIHLDKEFLEQSLEAYFISINYDPTEEGLIIND